MMTLQNNETPKVQWVEIDEEYSGQRLDNFLINMLKGVPKTRIYRIIRKGEVRVNKGRVNNKYRLEEGDMIRIPPVRIAKRDNKIELLPTLKYSLEQDILYEDDVLIVLNKPSGFAVHGGTGINSGVIEALRILRPGSRFLELAHRLDKDTSGCLLVAKKRTTLKILHELFRDNEIKKTYLALLMGQWNCKKMLVTKRLLRNTGIGGERIVKVSNAGKYAETYFRRLQKYKDFTLVEATPKTGRTHQIRVHAAWLGYPIVGDTRYGDQENIINVKKRGYKRLFLHAEKLQFVHPVSGDLMSFKVPLAQELQSLISHESRS